MLLTETSSLLKALLLSHTFVNNKRTDNDNKTKSSTGCFQDSRASGNKYDGTETSTILCNEELIFF